MSIRDLIIVGAGPSGLSAAIAAKQRSLDYQVLEQGVLVNSIFRFPPLMVFFTTAELLEIGGLPFVSAYAKPTRAEALIYYRKVVDAYDLQIAFDETVLSIEREGARGHADPGGEASVRAGGGAPAPAEEEAGEAIFAVQTRSSKAVRRVRHARHVIMAIGYYDRPVMLGIPGEDLPHVSHYYREPHPHYRQRVVVVGGGNSAAESSLELHRAGAFVTLVHRGPELDSTIKYWVRPDIENRIKEGSIAARFGRCVTEIRPTSVMLGRTAPTRGRESTLEAEEQRSAASERGWGPASVEEVEKEELPADAVLLLTGYRADVDLMREAGVVLTERDAPTYNPETFETNVPGLFVAGGAVAGVDTGRIFIENGRFHGEKIVQVIAGRMR